MKEGADSRQRIIVAATEVFAQKGKHGARMEEIAAKAEVNKAMVYYYYSTKDSLFRAILVTILRRVYDHVFDILGSEDVSDANPAEKVARLVNAHFIAFSEDVRFAKILLHALANEPGDLKAAIRIIRDEDETSKPRLPEALLTAVKEGILKREFRELDASQVLISIIGMSLIYFIDKAIAETLLNQKVESDETFLRERGKGLIDLVLHGVMGRPNPSRKQRSPRSGGTALRKRAR
jgi:TetR/AcrR family transcriptional regulator